MFGLIPIKWGLSGPYLHELASAYMVGDETGRSQSDVARRRFLAAVGITGTAAFAGCSAKSIGAPVAVDDSEDAEGVSDGTHSSPDLERWVDEVPRPGVIEPSGTKDGQPHYEVEMAGSNRSSTATFRRRPCGATVGSFPGRRSKPNRANRSTFGGRTTSQTNTCSPRIRRSTAISFRTTSRAPASFRTSTVATSNTRATGNRRRGSPVTSNRRVQTSRRKTTTTRTSNRQRPCGTTTTRSVSHD